MPETREPLINKLEDQGDRAHCPCWFLTTKVPVYREGQAIGLIGISRDITVLKSDRPYRPSWPEERVREHIRVLAGSHFDPQVVQAFCDLPDEVFERR